MAFQPILKAIRQLLAQIVLSPAGSVTDTHRSPSPLCNDGRRPWAAGSRLSCVQASHLSAGFQILLANEKDHNLCNARKTMFLGGWNVRSCFRRAKKELIIKQLKKHRIQVAALSETAIYNSGVTEIGDYTMIYSGVAGDDKTRSAHGVAVCLNKQATRVWKDSGSVWEAVNERIIMVRLGGKPINISLIAVYAPTNPSKGQKAAADGSDTFYINLQQTVDKGEGEGV